MDIDRFRFEICKKVTEAVRPDGPITRDEYLLRLAGLCDAAALLWCKLQGVNPADYPPPFLLEISQAASDGMTERGNEIVSQSN